MASGTEHAIDVMSKKTKYAVYCKLKLKLSYRATFGGILCSAQSGRPSPMLLLQEYRVPMNRAQRKKCRQTGYKIR